MARIAGVNLPNQKRLEVGLTYIYGIGRSTAQKICAETGLSQDEKIKDLTGEAVAHPRRACHAPARARRPMPAPARARRRPSAGARRHRPRRRPWHLLDDKRREV